MIAIHYRPVPSKVGIQLMLLFWYNLFSICRIIKVYIDFNYFFNNLEFHGLVYAHLFNHYFNH